MSSPKESEWDDFGNDLYAIPEELEVQSNNAMQDAPSTNKADEDIKIKALVNTPALDWQRQSHKAFSSGGAFVRSMGGRMMGTRGFGQNVFGWKTPPASYICHRCKIPGHFIQHCPTNGDPNYDIKRLKPPTGIPKSMLMETPDGSYTLPSGAVAILKPNEAAFEKEIKGLPSSRSVSDIAPELNCPLCKEVMKDAVLSSKCCFASFCDKCIRDHIISKSMCACGVANVVADDLIPNMTLRDAINRLLESDNSSVENAGSMLQIQDMKSALSAQPKVSSPTLPAASKGEQMPPSCEDDNLEIKEIASKANDVGNVTQRLLEKGNTAKVADMSEAAPELRTLKETSPGNAILVEEEALQMPSVLEPGKKKKTEKSQLPFNVVDIQWRTPQDVAVESHNMMPFGPSACNPYWGGMQLGMHGFMNPCVGSMLYMGYLHGLPNGPLGRILPQDFYGGYMMPVVPPQRDLSEFAMDSNPAPPIMSRQESVACKADLRRKRETVHNSESDLPEIGESGREVVRSGAVSSRKSRHAEDSLDYHHHHHREQRVARSHCHRRLSQGTVEPIGHKRRRETKENEMVVGKKIKVSQTIYAL